MTDDDELYKNWCLLGEKKNSSHAQQTRPCFFFFVPSKMSDEHPRLFYYWVAPSRN